MNTLIFALPGNESLTDALAQAPGFERGEWTCRPFADGETHLRFHSPVQGRDVVLACTLDHPDAKLLRLYLVTQTLRELGAQRVRLVAPYLPYMRQDRAFEEGEGVSARHVAELLSRCFDGLITVDPHLHRITRLEQVYDMPCRVVPAAPVIAAWVRQHVERPLIVGPDSESEQWVSAVARMAGCEYRVLAKTRHGDREVEIDAARWDAPAGCQPVLVDDIIATGRTQLAAMAQLRALALPAPICVGVHALLVGNAMHELKAAGCRRVVTCNSIVHPSNAIDLHPDVSAALQELTLPSH